MKMTLEEFEARLAQLPEIACARCNTYSPHVFYDGYDKAVKVICLCSKAGYIGPDGLCVCFSPMADVDRVWKAWISEGRRLREENENREAQ